MGMKNIANRIRLLLVTREKSQKELGIYLGKKQSNMSHLMKSERFTPEDLEKTAEFLEVNVKDLLEDPEFMPKPEPKVDPKLWECLQKVDNLTQLVEAKESALSYKDEIIKVQNLLITQLQNNTHRIKRVKQKNHDK